VKTRKKKVFFTKKNKKFFTVPLPRENKETPCEKGGSIIDQIRVYPIFFFLKFFCLRFSHRLVELEFKKRNRNESFWVFINYLG
jgi:hypothetical protein